VIARVWTGRVRAEQADAYLAYLKKTGLPHCRSTPGNRGVSILRRNADGVASFVFTSRWDSWDAIRAFAGPEPEQAVYYPEDRAFLLELDPHVRHYEVLVDEDA
jgi:heme-degrading monooxygenase HmoA